MVLSETDSDHLFLFPLLPRRTARLTFFTGSLSASLDFPRIPSTWNQGTQTGTEKAQAVTIRFNEVDAFQALHGA